MIANSCTISCLAKAYNLSVLSVHRTALALGIDCKIDGINYDQAIRINNRIKEQGHQLVYRYMVNVIDNTPEFHSIISMGDNSFWCHNYGFIPKLRKDYMLQGVIDLKTNEFIPHVYTDRELMAYCNANCSKRITTKSVSKWFSGDPIQEAWKHILYWRHVSL